MLGVCETNVVFNEINSMEKSVAAVARSSRTLDKLLVHLARFSNWPNFIGEFHSSVKANQNVCIAAKLLISRNCSGKCTSTRCSMGLGAHQSLADGNTTIWNVWILVFVESIGVTAIAQNNTTNFVTNLVIVFLAIWRVTPSEI